MATQKGNYLSRKQLSSLFDGSTVPGNIMLLPFLAIMAAPLLEFIRRYPNINDYPEGYFPFVVCFLYLAGIAGLAAFFYCLKENNRTLSLRHNAPMVFFVITVVWMLLSTAVNGITPEVLYGDVYRRESLYTFVAYFLFLYYGATFIRNEKQKSILLGIYLISSTILALREFAAYMTLPAEVIEKLATVTYMGIVTSVFEQFNHYGYYLTVAVLISSVIVRSDIKPLRYLAAVSFLVNSAVLVLNNTFGAFLGCLIGLVFSIIVCSLCSRKLDRTAIGMLAAFLVIALLTNLKCKTLFQNFTELFSDVGKIASGAEDARRAGTNRWGIVSATVRYISERPLLGFGVEGIGKRLLSEVHIDRPHCEYLQYAAFFGIPAAVSYVLGILHIYLNGLRHRFSLSLCQKAALIAAFGYLASAAFGNTMYYTAPYLFLLLGIGYSADSNP